MEPKVSTIKLTGLEPDSKNANDGTARGQKALEDSIQEFGFVEAGTLDKNNRIIGGNKRYEAVGAVGLSDDVIIIDTDGTKPIYLRTPYDLDTPEGRRLAHALNRVHELSYAVNHEQLLADIESGVKLDDLFNEQDLQRILEEAGSELLGNGAGNLPPEPEPIIDKAEQLQEKWQVKPGDLWLIESKANPGQYHRLLCGDCRNPDDLVRLCDGRKMNGVFTSPPYAEQRKQQYGGVPVAEYVEWWEAVQSGVRNVLAGDGSFFVNIKPHSLEGERELYVFDLVIAMKRLWGWRFIDELCWKQVGIPGDPVKMKRFKNQFEPVYQFALGEYKFTPEHVMFESDDAILDDNYQPGFTRNFQGKGSDVFSKRQIGKGLVYPGNVLEFHTNEAWGHEAAFPVSLVSFFIKSYSDPGDRWLDPFAGSGTVGIATEQESRLGLMCEILPKYCSVILERFTAKGFEPKLVN